MGISRRRIWVTAAASLATLTAVAGMTLASHTVRPASGWIGQCYPQINANNESGWCDGNGPV